MEVRILTWEEAEAEFKAEQEDLSLIPMIVPKCMDKNRECVKLRFSYTEDQCLEGDEFEKVRGIRAYLADLGDLGDTSVHTKKKQNLCPSVHTEKQVQVRYFKGTAIMEPLEQDNGKDHQSTLETFNVADDKSEFRHKVISTDFQDNGNFEQEIARSLEDLCVPAEAHPEAIQELLKVLSTVTPDQMVSPNPVAYLDIYFLTLFYPELSDSPPAELPSDSDLDLPPRWHI